MIELKLFEALALEGREFAMLSEEELAKFNYLRSVGRRYGIFVTIEPLNNTMELQAKLKAASSLKLQDEIYRNVRAKIKITHFAKD